MVETTIAKCEHCGAALRIRDAEDGAIRCAYCGVETLVAAWLAPERPRLRLLEAEPPKFPFVAMAAGLAVCLALVCLAEWLPRTRDYPPPQLLRGVAASFFLFCLIELWSTRSLKRRWAERQWLRENGIAARACVTCIASNGGRKAVLSLRIDVAEQPVRNLEHETTIPELIVPRLVTGATLPVVVHPTESEVIEVQWQLI